MGRPKKENQKNNNIENVPITTEMSEQERFDIIEEVENEYFSNVSDKYDYQRTVEEIKFYQEQASVSFIEMGKRLLRIKAHEPHGRFIHALNELGIERTTAFRCMQATKKFANVVSPQHLGREKMKILSVLDDEEIKELENEKEIFGLTFDDIDRMSTRELRKNLREAREKAKHDRDNLENIIKQKEEKNNELERMVRGLETISAERIAQEKTKEYIQPFMKLIGAITMDFFSLKRMIDEVQSIEGTNLIIIEEFQEHFNEMFKNLENERLNFFDVYDNAHVYSREEQLQYGVIANYGEGFPDEKRRY